jgi:hypothetical protein
MASPAPAPVEEKDGLIARNPGIVATLVTFLVAGVFLGALYHSATSGHSSGGHGESHGGESAPAHH